MALWKITTVEDSKAIEYSTYTKDGMEFIIKLYYTYFNLMVDTDVPPAIPAEGVEGGYNASKNELNLPYNSAYHEAAAAYDYKFDGNNISDEQWYQTRDLLKDEHGGFDINNTDKLIQNGWVLTDKSVRLFGPLSITQQ